jgi:hypothetical protein
MYHLAKYPTNHYSIWESAKEWTSQVEFIQYLKYPTDDASLASSYSSCIFHSNLQSPTFPPVEASFFIARFVVFSSESMEDIILHATVECIDETNHSPMRLNEL